MAKNLITQAAFATTMGVDRAQVTRWIGKGMPTESDGVNPAVAAVWVRTHVDSVQRDRRSNGRAQIAEGEAARGIEAADQMGRVALRLAIHAMPGVARASALDAGLSAEQAEAVYVAALSRAPDIEQPVKNAMDIPESDAEPLDEITHPAEIGRDPNGVPVLIWGRTEVQEGELRRSLAIGQRRFQE